MDSGDLDRLQQILEDGTREEALAFRLEGCDQPETLDRIQTWEQTFADPIAVISVPKRGLVMGLR